MAVNYAVGDKVKMKKAHPCGENVWEITRIGMDFRIRCVRCDRQVLLPRVQFEKSVKQVLEKA